MEIGLYIHVPFCVQKCLYCDFTSYDNMTDLFWSYTDALLQEIGKEGAALAKDGVQVSTVYFGGGTPTALPIECLERLLSQVKKSFSLLPEAEVTMEVNPGTADAEKMALLRSYGVNRLSFGVQSFDDAVLEACGRIHRSEEAIGALQAAKVAGVSNVSLDLMYGLPHQTFESLKESLTQALELDVTHVSVYGLKVEENTPFFYLEKQGKLELPDEDVEVQMYQFVNEFLPSAGFRRYEISNYAKRGYESRHNLRYWRYQPYLGLGVAAHSFLEGRRLANTQDVHEYIEIVSRGGSPRVECEESDVWTAMAEFVFLALRTADGLETAEFTRRFSVVFDDIYGQVTAELIEKDLVRHAAGRICLTERGMQFGNQVFEEFLPE